MSLMTMTTPRRTDLALFLPRFLHLYWVEGRQLAAVTLVAALLLSARHVAGAPCPTLTVLNGLPTNYSGPAGSIVNVTCAPGYDGGGLTNCTLSAVWSSSPDCTALLDYCSKPPSATDVRLNVTAGRCSETAVVSAYASSSDLNLPIYAFTGGAWRAPAFPTQWIEADFGLPVLMKTLRLLVNQFPNGIATHTVTAGTTTPPVTTVYSVTANFVDQQELVWNITSGYYRYVRITTTSGPSYVAWANIRVGPATTPCPIGSQVSYSCTTGYSPWNSTGTCSAGGLTAGSGVWSPPVIGCSVRQDYCSTPPSAPNVTVSTTGSCAVTGVVRANASLSDSNLPIYAFTGGSWRAPGYPTQWIEGDFGTPIFMTTLRLVVNMAPSGPATHNVTAGTTTPPTLTVFTITSTFTDQSQLVWNISSGYYRYVRITTTSGPSYVSWADIRVAPATTPCPIGSQVSFSCPAGSHPSSSTATCTAGGTWSPLTVGCSGVTTGISMVAAATTGSRAVTSTYQTTVTDTMFPGMAGSCCSEDFLIAAASGEPLFSVSAFPKACTCFGLSEHVGGMRVGSMGTAIRSRSSMTVPVVAPPVGQSRTGTERASVLQQVMWRVTYLDATKLTVSASVGSTGPINGAYVAGISEVTTTSATVNVMRIDDSSASLEPNLMVYITLMELF